MQKALARGAVVALVASLTIGVAASPARAATLPSGFSETIISGLSGPTAMDFAPDGRIFVAEKNGKVRVIEGGKLLPTPFVTLTVDTAGERGLIGMTLAPSFPITNRVYVHYTVPASGAI